jgi:hypothetical protein
MWRPERQRVFPALLLIAGLIASGAPAATSSVVPPGIQQTIKKSYPQFPYVPTALPPGFRYIKWHRAKIGFDIYFGRQSSLPDLGFHALKVSCAGYGHAIKTFRLNGVNVYWSATYEDQQAWRCLTRSHLHVVLSASRSVPGDDTTSTTAGRRDALYLARLVAFARRVG